MDMEREVTLVLTVEQIELILDAVNAVNAEDLYGPWQYECTCFYDSIDYKLEMIARQLNSQLC
jgi:hypothetical protein